MNSYSSAGEGRCRGRHRLCRAGAGGLCWPATRGCGSRRRCRPPAGPAAPAAAPARPRLGRPIERARRRCRSRTRCDVVFLALPDAGRRPASAPALVGARPCGSSTCRAPSACGTRRPRARWYPATAAAAGASPVYGLTEHYRGDVRRADARGESRAAIRRPRSLALLPLVAAGLLDRAAASSIDAKSGVSGAGKTPTERTHFSECHGNRVAAYGVFGTVTPPRSSRSSASAGHVRAAPACRSTAASSRPSTRALTPAARRAMP